jgi:hypothetical protein
MPDYHSHKKVATYHRYPISIGENKDCWHASTECFPIIRKACSNKLWFRRT